MALQESGVILVAKGYSEYMRKMGSISAAHKSAFATGPITGYKRAAADATAATGGMAMSFRSLASTAKVVAIALGGLKLLQFAKQSVEVAARSETMGVALTQVGEASGYTSEQIAYATDQLKEQGITTLSAQQSLLRMARANISWAEASKLARIAQSSAVVAGIDSSAAFNRLVLGIQKMEPELLDELGITLRRNEAYKELADTLGKNSKELTDAERKQAILNNIYAQSSMLLGDGAGKLSVYEAAMETAGKKQGSLTRHIEETQLNLGKMLLPLKSASVDLQTTFWKGARQATLGMSSFSAALDITITGLLNLPSVLQGTGKELENHKGFWERIGEAIHNFAKGTALAIAAFSAKVQVHMRKASEAVATWGQVWEDIRNFDPGAALDKIKSIGDTFEDTFDQDFTEQFRKNVEILEQQFPQLFQSFEELGEAAKEVDLDPLGDEAKDAADEVAAQMEKVVEALRSVEQIQENFGRALANAAKQREAALADLSKSRQKQEALAEKNLVKDLERLAENTAKSRKQITAQTQKDVTELTKNHYKDLARAEEQYNLDRLQSRRRFLVADRRLQAEGDVLALMNLREDFALQQKEAEENREQEKKYANEDIRDAVDQRKEEGRQALAELEAAAKEQRDSLIKAFQDESKAREEAYAEQQAQIEENYQKQIQAAKEARQEQLEELGKQLKEQGELTEEGMNKIYEIMDETFGESGSSMALMKGWADATKSIFSEAIESIKNDLNQLNDDLQSASEGLTTEEATTGPSSTAHPRPVPMRYGGSGVVTGPAIFQVEPGVREHVAFTPVGQFQDVQVSGSADINVNGLTAGVGAELEGQIANEILSAIHIAAKRIHRRR